VQSFAYQRTLAEHRRLLIPDRRGFGASPDLDGSDFTADYMVDARDVADLLGDGAHLLGHSYGGTVAMLAAAARPDAVRSLTLIEPCAHTIAADQPVVATAIEDGRRFMAGARRGTPEEYVAMAYGDRPGPQPRQWLLRAAATALHERPCWLADLATEPLAAAETSPSWSSSEPGMRSRPATDPAGRR
jgi:pimeloyl-ACP methyl ester carboxylesterase